MQEYGIVRKYMPVEDEGERYGPILIRVRTEDNGIIISLTPPKYRSSDVWGQDFLTAWNASGLTTIDELKNMVVDNYNNEYVVAQLSGDEIVGSP
jgi:hypothetical protein